MWVSDLLVPFLMLKSKAGAIGIAWESKASGGGSKGKLWMHDHAPISAVHDGSKDQMTNRNNGPQGAKLCGVYKKGRGKVAPCS